MEIARPRNVFIIGVAIESTRDSPDENSEMDNERERERERERELR